MKKQFVILLCVGGFLGLRVQGQSADSLFSEYVADYDSAGFVYFKPNTLTPGQPYSLYRSYTGDTLHELTLIRQWEDSLLGMQHYRYQETYRDLPVEAAEYTEHATDGYLVFANGKVAQFDGDRGYEATYDNEDALAVVIDSMPDYDFAWLDSDWEQDLKDDLGDSNATYYPEGELMYALENYHNLTCYIPSTKYRLAWRFDILCLNPSFHKAYYIDATTGEVFREDQLTRTNGPADILTQGTKTIDTRWKGGLTSKHILWANDNNRDVHTKYESGWSWGLRSEIKDGDDIWGSSEQEGTTPHWMVTQAWDFYVNQYHRASMDGTGDEVRVEASSSRDGAAYEARGKRDYMVFGDLDNHYSAIIDVSGHEYTHGVTEHTANLAYQNESGALDESFADIFGFMVERFAEPSGSLDWRIGEDGHFTVNHTRSLEDPNDWGEHITGTGTLAVGQPDTYEGTFWYTGTADYGGVHVNSGVQNFWFYLLAVGGAGTNDNGDGYNLQGIGIDDAALIAYWNLTTILQSGAQYADARAGAIAAARLIFGNCSTEEIETTNAWAAVGVGNPSNCRGTGVDQVLAKGTVVFPNPAQNEISISFVDVGERTIKLYATSGAYIRSVAVKTSNSCTLNIGDLPSGVYILHITDGDESNSLKFIKY